MTDTRKRYNPSLASENHTSPETRPIKTETLTKGEKREIISPDTERMEVHLVYGETSIHVGTNRGGA